MTDERKLLPWEMAVHKDFVISPSAFDMAISALDVGLRMTGLLPVPPRNTVSDLVRDHFGYNDLLPGMRRSPVPTAPKISAKKRKAVAARKAQKLARIARRKGESK